MVGVVVAVVGHPGGEAVVVLPELLGGLDVEEGDLPLLQCLGQPHHRPAVAGDVLGLGIDKGDGAVGELHHRVLGIYVLHHRPVGEGLNAAVELNEEVALVQGAVGGGVGGGEEVLEPFKGGLCLDRDSLAPLAGGPPAVAQARLSGIRGAPGGKAYPFTGGGCGGQTGEEQDGSRGHGAQEEDGAGIAV